MRSFFLAPWAIWGTGASKPRTGPRRIQARNLSLEKLAAGQKKRIAANRAQVQALACQINEMTAHLAQLEALEAKVRILADLDGDPEGNATPDAEGVPVANAQEGTITQEGTMGMGGPTSYGLLPEEMEPSLPLTVTHDALVRDMHDALADVEAAAQGHGIQLASLHKSLVTKRDILACTPSIRPVDGWVTSRFGRRKSPFTGQTEFHRGLDLAAAKGTPVKAPANGRVTFVGKKGAMGMAVVVDHGHGMVTRYGHLNKIFKKKGDWVKRGETIAEVGMSGRTTGPHLHYEVHVNGIPVNPAKYVLN